MKQNKLSDAFLKGGWFPINDATHTQFLSNIVTAVVEPGRYCDNDGTSGLLPKVEALKKFIDSDGKIYLGFTEMVRRAQIDGIGNDYVKLIRVMNEIIQRSPTYGSVGPPIYMVLAQAMNTSEGFNTFLHEGLNRHFKAMFTHWTDFLSSEKSRYVLTDDVSKGGWFTKDALKALTVAFPGKSFFEIFESVDDPKQYYGFKSFEDFFNRRLRAGIRPVEDPYDPNVISAACESTVYNISHNVQPTSDFWLKGEPYSLQHMLQGHFVDEFTGGTIFQGFLSITAYHRWNSPVTGTIERIVPIEGTYFAQSPNVLQAGQYGSEPPPPGPDLSTNPYLRSLAFITSLTTRTLIFIRSENEAIGLMCFIAVGMTEISTCALNENIKEGYKVTRGEELGMFRFGGSSHVLLFGPNVDITFDERIRSPGDHVAVRSKIATVMPPNVQQPRSSGWLSGGWLLVR